jgi:hypothetical protein
MGRSPSRIPRYLTQRVNQIAHKKALSYEQRIKETFLEKLHLARSIDGGCDVDLDVLIEELSELMPSN